MQKIERTKISYVDEQNFVKTYDFDCADNPSDYLQIAFHILALRSHYNFRHNIRDEKFLVEFN